MCFQWCFATHSRRFLDLFRRTGMFSSQLFHISSFWQFQTHGYDALLTSISGPVCLFPQVTISRFRSMPTSYQILYLHYYSPTHVIICRLYRDNDTSLRDKTKTLPALSGSRVLQSYFQFYFQFALNLRNFSQCEGVYVYGVTPNFKPAEFCCISISSGKVYKPRVRWGLLWKIITGRDPLLE